MTQVKSGCNFSSIIFVFVFNFITARGVKLHYVIKVMSEKNEKSWKLFFQDTLLSILLHLEECTYLSQTLKLNEL